MFSCKNDTKISDISKIISEWRGKKVEFPQDTLIMFLSEDSDYFRFNTPYKILTYIDSAGCTNCNFNLFEWNLLISEVDTYMKDSLCFLFYFHPKNEKELNDFAKRAKMEKFTYPIFYDKEGIINRLNNFPSIVKCQCFLLNQDNEVVVVGNPTLSTKVWELYKKEIYK
jgi:hypothetical protein